MSTLRAVVFDAYGTLFDVHSVAARCDELFPQRGRELSQLWRSKQLEYSWLRSLMGRYEPFESVTHAALLHACRALGLPLPQAAVPSLMQQYRRLAPYSDVDAGLRALSAHSLAILSNGSPDMLHAVVGNADLASTFSAVLSVDEVQIYKPHPSVYQLAVDRLGIAKEDIAFVSSNFWDVTGATAFGFKTFWINRSDAQADELGYEPVAIVQRLDQLAQVLN